MPGKEEENQKWYSINTLIKGLVPPEYKLIFGLFLVFVLFGIGSSIYGIINHDVTALYLSFYSFIACLISAIIVIVIRQNAPHSRNTLILNFDMKKIKKDNKDFEANLERGKCVAWIVRKPSKIVNKEMEVVPGGGNWILKIQDVEPEKTLNVKLVEINHREWEASIHPYVQSISSIREVSKIK